MSETIKANLAEAEVYARRSMMLRATGASLDTLAEIVFRKGDQAGAKRFIDWAQNRIPTLSF